MKISYANVFIILLFASYMVCYVEQFEQCSNDAGDCLFMGGSINGSIVHCDLYRDSAIQQIKNFNNFVHQHEGQ